MTLALLGALVAGFSVPDRAEAQTIPETGFGTGAVVRAPAETAPSRLSATSPYDRTTPQPCELRPDLPSLSLAPCAELLRSPPAGAQAETVKDSDAFTPVGARFHSLGYVRDAVWYRMRLTRAPEAPRRWTLVLGRLFLDDLAVTVIDAAGSAHRTRVGDRVAAANGRPGMVPGYAMPLDFGPGDALTVLVQVSTTGALTFDAHVWQTDAFLTRARTSALMQGAFFGVVGLALLFYVSIGIGQRDAAMLSYTLYLASVAASYAGITGVGPALAPDAPPILFDLAARAGSILAVTGFLLFGVYGFDLRRMAPRLARLCLMAAALPILALPFINGPLYPWLAPPLYVMGLLAGTCNVGMAAWRAWLGREVTENIVYVVAFLIAALGGWARVLVLLGLLPKVPILLEAYQGGTLVHVVVMGLALVMRLRRLTEDRETARQQALQADARERDQRRLMALLSHEFRAPLAGLKTAAETVLVTTPTLPAEATARLRRIVARANGLLGLFQRFLDAETLDQGRLRPLIAAVPPAVLVDRVRGRLSGGDLPVRLQVDLTRAPDTLAVDSGLMEQAISNLVDNALRYAPDDTRVTLSITQPSGGGVRLEVCDQGPGMSEEEVAALGTRYFRGAAAPGTRGTGLGLYLTRRIVTAHGGQLSFDSALGAGTRAIVDLPPGIAPVRTLKDDALSPSRERREAP